jgi:hypothetical protein
MRDDQYNIEFVATVERYPIKRRVDIKKAYDKKGLNGDSWRREEETEEKLFR